MRCKGIGLAAGLLLSAVLSNESRARSIIQYDYLAYSRGLPAGEAEVRVVRDGPQYSIHGEAEATGLFRLFSAWESSFQVAGHVGTKMPVLTSYQHVESNRSRIKEVKVVDGITHYVRNGEARESVEAAAAIDVFSLIFVHGRCDQSFRAHSGRMGFDIVLEHSDLTDARETCVYSVLDDEGEQFDAIVSLAEFKGLRAPVELDFEGYELGKFRLQDVEVHGE